MYLSISENECKDFLIQEITVTLDVDMRLFVNGEIQRLKANVNLLCNT
jgi:hypothetical protein